MTGGGVRANPREGDKFGKIQNGKCEGSTELCKYREVVVLFRETRSPGSAGLFLKCNLLSKSCAPLTASELPLDSQNDRLRVKKVGLFFFATRILPLMFSFLPCIFEIKLKAEVVYR